MEANILQSKTFYLPNWTHIKSATVTRERARFNLDWPSNAFIILHSGNMGLKQNLENVIETAKLFRREENFRFVLCGDGSQKKTLINLAKGVDTISFLESVDEMEYPNLLLAADVLLINERSSVGNMSLPSKLTSYLAAGRPVLAAVSSDGACASELQRTGGAGVIVPAENPADLARAIRFLRDNPEKIQKMSNLALKYSQEYLLKSKAESTISSLLDSIKMTKK
jgi:glycosyltransferase involved in cell wall biosynthesis